MEKRINSRNCSDYMFYGLVAGEVRNRANVLKFQIDVSALAKPVTKYWLTGEMVKYMLAIDVCVS